MPFLILLCMALPLQGCNLALESVRVFASTLDSLAASSFTNSSSSSAQSSAAAAAGTATAVDVDALVQAYTKARLADVHAFQQLELSQVRQWAVGA